MHRQEFGTHDGGGRVGTQPRKEGVTGRPSLPCTTGVVYSWETDPNTTSMGNTTVEFIVPIKVEAAVSGLSIEKAVERSFV